MPCIALHWLVHGFIVSYKPIFCVKVNHLIISSLTQDEQEINMLFKEQA